MAEQEEGNTKERIKYRDILYNNDQLGPFPTHLLKYVDRPTNRIVGPIERRDPRESIFSRSARGDLGKEIQEEFMRMTARYRDPGRVYAHDSEVPYRRSPCGYPESHKLYQEEPDRGGPSKGTDSK